VFAATAVAQEAGHATGTVCPSEGFSRVLFPSVKKSIMDFILFKSMHKLYIDNIYKYRLAAILKASGPTTS
jgi:hypothetical protein